MADNKSGFNHHSVGGGSPQQPQPGQHQQPYPHPQQAYPQQPHPGQHQQPYPHPQQPHPQQAYPQQAYPQQPYPGQHQQPGLHARGRPPGGNPGGLTPERVRKLENIIQGSIVATGTAICAGFGYLVAGTVGTLVGALVGLVSLGFITGFVIMVLRWIDLSD